MKIWEKIVVVSPKSAEIYLKIAEYYLRNQSKDGAAHAFIEGGNRLVAKNKHEQAAAAFLRAIETETDDLEAVSGYVSSQISLGYPEEAVKILDKIYDRDPHNSQIVFMMVDCYLDMDDAEKSERVLVGLVEQNPKAYTKLLDLVSFYLKKDDLDSAIRILSMISQQLLVSQKPERLLDLLNEVITRNPEHIQALRLLTQYYSWCKDEIELERVLEQLLDAANLNESTDDERYAITQLLLISPQEAKYINRLKEMNDFQQPGADVGVLDPDQIKNDGMVPTFEEFEGLLRGNSNGNGGDSALNESVVGFADDSFSEEVAQIQLTEADLQTGFDEGESGAENLKEKEKEEKKEKKKELDIGEQIENLKFYIDQGYVEIAEHTIKELDEEFSLREEFDEIRAIIKNARKETGDEMGFETTVETKAKADTRAKKTSKAEETDEMSDKDPEAVKKGQKSDQENKVSDELKANTASETEETAQDAKADIVETEEVVKSDDEYETHYHHAIAYKEMGLLKDAIREFQSAVASIPPDDHSDRFLQCSTLLGHCFSEQNLMAEAIAWLEKAFVSDGLGDAEKQAITYELGSAHFANGNYQEALKLFERIYLKDAEYRDVAARVKECEAKMSLVAA